MDISKLSNQGINWLDVSVVGNKGINWAWISHLNFLTKALTG